MTTIPSAVSEFENQPTVCREPVVPRSAGKPASGTVGPYELLEQVGRGGMGVVYRARDTRDNRIVALKMMRDDLLDRSQEAKRRLRREAQAIAQLHHPHIVPIHEVCVEGEQPFIALAFVNGGTLEAHRKRFMLDHRHAVVVLEKIARAVQHAHECGVLHRDLKPSNVLLDEQGEPLIGDFGLAKFLTGTADQTRPGELLGTPAYMAPEQAARDPEQIGPPTDIWALGVVLFELVTGLKPFPREDDARVLQAIQSAEPLRPRTIRPDLDPRLEAMILRCLARKPTERYTSAAALAADLQRWLQREPVAAQARWWPRRLVHWLQHRSALSATVFLALAIAAVVLILPTQPSQAPSDGLQTVLQRLAGGERVELLPGGELPPWHRWPANRIGQTNPGPLQLTTFTQSLLEVLPQVPNRHYRLQAEVAAASLDLGEVGFYFAYCSNDSPRGPEDFFCALSYAQTDHINRAALMVHRSAEFRTRPGAIYHTATVLSYSLPPATPRSAWHQLSVEVSPEKLAAFWEGKPMGEVTWPTLLRHVQKVASREPAIAPPTELPSGGALGFFVKGGMARFRSLVIEPLD